LPFGHASEFGQTTIRAAAGQHGDDVDGFCDQGAGNGDDGFLDELLNPLVVSSR
jgi:hypothetical protein